LGHSHGVAGAVQRPVTEPRVLDIHLPAGTRLSQDLHVAVYTYRGVVDIAGTPIQEQRLAVLS
jgi:redox-sensitive bicupin YhaK (pirin superfamily)